MVKLLSGEYKREAMAAERPSSEIKATFRKEKASTSSPDWQPPYSIEGHGARLGGIVFVDIKNVIID